MTAADVADAAVHAFGRALYVDENRYEFWVDYGNDDLSLDDLERFAAILGTEPDYDGVCIRPDEMCAAPGQTGSPKLEIVVRRKRV